MSEWIPARLCSVDGDVLQTELVCQRFNPTAKACLEDLRVQPVEDALEGIVRRNALGQTEETFEPGAASLREGDDLLPIIGPTDNGTQGYDDDVEQGVSPERLATWVPQGAEEPNDGQRWIEHDSPP